MEWCRQFPELRGGGIDSWIGVDPGDEILITLWFGDEDSGGELEAGYFALEACRLTHVAVDDPDAPFPVRTAWKTLFDLRCESRDDLLAAFERMKEIGIDSYRRERGI